MGFSQSILLKYRYVKNTVSVVAYKDNGKGALMTCRRSSLKIWENSSIFFDSALSSLCVGHLALLERDCHYSSVKSKRIISVMIACTCSHLWRHAPEVGLTGITNGINHVSGKGNPRFDGPVQATLNVMNAANIVVVKDCQHPFIGQTHWLRFATAEQSVAPLPGRPSPLYATMFHATTKDRVLGKRMRIGHF